MKRFNRLSLIIFCWLSWFVSAEELVESQEKIENNPNTSQQLEDGLNGFTIDNTITRIGHDFVRYFSDFRNSEYPDAQYNLVIHERPSARWGNLIWITFEYNTIFRQFLRPNIANIKPQAESIAKQIHENIEQMKLQQLFSDKFDLSESEI